MTQNTSPSARASIADMDAVIDNVSGKTVLNGIGTAAQDWQDLGTNVLGWLSVDQSAPQGSLGDCAKLLAGWTGDGADAFIKAVNQVSSFGISVGQAAYDQAGEDYADNTAGYQPTPATFRTSLAGLQGNLGATFDAHTTWKQQYGSWVKAVASGIYNVVTPGGQGQSNNDPVSNMGSATDWAPATWTLKWHSTADTNSASITTHYDITVLDGRQSVPLSADNYGNTSQAPGGGQVTFFTDGEGNGYMSASDLEQWVRTHFTDLYHERVGPLVDGIIGSGNNNTSGNNTSGSTSVYDQANDLLPTKRDESKLPGADTSGNGNGGNGYGGNGYGGIGTGGLPGGLGTGVGSGGLAGGKLGGGGGLGGAGSGGLDGGKLGGSGPGGGGLGGAGGGGLDGGKLGGGGLGGGASSGGLGAGGGGLGNGGGGSGSSLGGLPGGLSAGVGPGSSGIGSGGITPTHLAGYTPPGGAGTGVPLTLGGGGSGPGGGSVRGGFGAPGSLSTPGGLGTGGVGAGGLGTGGLGAGGVGAGGVGAGLGAGGVNGGGLGSGAGGLGAAGAAGEAATAGGMAGADGVTGRSGMPMMPPMMPPQGGNQDRERQRKSWLPDDEDIWGTDDVGVPPVISGE